jgi:hypothetical protein
MTQPRTTSSRKTRSGAKPKVPAKKQQRATFENLKTAQKKRGRSPVDDSDENNSEQTDDDDSEPEPVAKKARTRKTKGNLNDSEPEPVAKKARTRRTKNEVEIVDDDVEPVEDEIEIVSEDDVSTGN